MYFKPYKSFLAKAEVVRCFEVVAPFCLSLICRVNIFFKGPSSYKDICSIDLVFFQRIVENCFQALLTLKAWHFLCFT